MTWPAVSSAVYWLDLIRVFITQELSVCIFDKKMNTFAVLLIKKKNLANQSALQPFIPNISPSLLGMVNYSKMSFKGQMC